MERRASTPVQPLGPAEMTEFRAVNLLSAAQQILDGQRVETRIRRTDTPEDLKRVLAGSRAQLNRFLISSDYTFLFPFGEQWGQLLRNNFEKETDQIYPLLKVQGIRRLIGKVFH